MKRLPFRSFIRFVQHLAPVALVLGVVVILALWVGSQPVHALPEYATRTGEACATCHVNPGGGGPRTLRGLLWAARGRPDQVPTLPGLLIAPGVTDGAELYDIACAGCHGAEGEGLFAMGLVGTGIGQNSIRAFIQRGIVRIGMPAFKGQFTDSQLEALVIYIARLSNGEIPPPPTKYPLPPPLFNCSPQAASATGACQTLRPSAIGGN